MMDFLGMILGYSGFVGAILIVCAWAFEAFESVERHRSIMDLKFAVIYIIAMSLLTVHSAMINDMVFIFMNVTIIVIAVFEVFYTIYLHKVKRRRKRGLLRH